jgi:hypothetical protein
MQWGFSAVLCLKFIIADFKYFRVFKDSNFYNFTIYTSIFLVLFLKGLKIKIGKLEILTLGSFRVLIVSGGDSTIASSIRVLFNGWGY